MLRLMRKHASSWLIKVLLGIIVIVFVFFGFGSYKSRKGNRIATVNGKQISIDAYRDKYHTIMAQYRQQFGNNLTDEVLKNLNVREQALETLISETLQLQEAKRLKIRVTDEELTNAILKVDAFQTNGQFDPELYNRLLSRNRLSPEGFEDKQRKEMLGEKLRLLITESVKVSEPEAREWFNWNKASVNIDLVQFEPVKYQDIKTSDEEIEEFFEANKTDYETEPELSVRYLHFVPEAYKSKVEISDDEVAEYYETNQKEFILPKTVEARHILLKIDQDASPEIVEDRRKDILQILTFARGGQEFAELAGLYSEGPTKDRGGYLGSFRKETMTKPFAEKAFSMNAGEISDPVRTRFGWHIIKVEKVNEYSTRSLDQATEIIRGKLVDRKAKIEAYDEAEDVFDVSIEGDDLILAAEERNLNISTTNFFTRNKPVEGIKDSIKFSEAAFQLQEMEISDVLDLNDGYYILQVIEKIPAKIPELEAVKADVTVDLKEKKQYQKALNDAEAFLAALKEGSTMSAEVEKYKSEIVSTGFLKRNEPIPNIGSEPAITDEVFSLSQGKKWTEQVIEGRKGYYVTEFKERKVPSPEAFDTEKTQIMKNLLMQKKYRAFEAWLAQLREKSEVIIEEGIIN